ncbi:type VI secretion system protein ImpJ [Enterobacter hormaechei]|nr:type VI secretion system protein ImpJ [Enterobacter hormaechei]
MTKAEKVVWTEGMFLRPHHFQRTESYLLNHVREWGGLAAFVSLGLSRP